MKVQFITSVGVVAPDPPASRKLYVDALGLPLEGEGQDGYYSSEKIPGSKHFGIWPLSQAAEACWRVGGDDADACNELDLHLRSPSEGSRVVRTTRFAVVSGTAVSVATTVLLGEQARSGLCDTLA